ncbi:uncharacterized protein EDB91DRAFT_256278 [Suillus paluster]|uniref:uncharacterized protein n=1 Tax=Suillus paluster TaxID=48578 RepID=UPI001B868279|nr:uncharacterized protein EDB91DRAFT_256278 [Suillus paluster]KAG1754850.1 hypothetical protein EDB91DRAFT_256278 [Suillus paluster]
MKPRNYADPFAPAHMGVKRCFCGNQTVEDHDFCFCSPECARADALRALGGDDCHYRKVVRKAYVSSGAPEPAIYRRKSENHLRRLPFAKQAILPSIPRLPKPAHQHNQPTMGGQDDRCVRNEMVFPTLAEVTSAILARKAKQTGDPSTKPPPVTAQISLDALPLTPSQQTRPSFGQGARKPPLAQLHSAPPQTMPLNVNNKTVTRRRRQESIFQSMAEESGTVNHRTKESSMSPRPQRQALPNTIVATPRSGNIHRSASFADCHSPAERSRRALEGGESLMQLFNQLEDVRDWIENFDGTPDSDA